MTTLKLTTAEALKAARRHKGKFCLHYSGDAPVVDSDSQVYLYALSTYVRLTRKDALRILGDLLSETLEAKGGRIPVNIRTDSFWIG
jgi:hypothetical protein